METKIPSSLGLSMPQKWSLAISERSHHTFQTKTETSEPKEFNNVYQKAWDRRQDVPVAIP